MAEKDPRLSGQALKVLKLMLEDPTRKLSGADMSKGAKVGPGTLYPLLMRLKGARWLDSEWEEIDPSEEGRPRRRYYWLTPNGRVKARVALEDVQVASIDGRLAWNFS